MSQYHGDEMDNVQDDYEMAEDNRVTDTSAADARRGKDIQGIPWERLSISREKHRQTRLEQYKNYENIPQSGEGSEKDCKPVIKGGLYYQFWRSTRFVKSTILHFQWRRNSTGRNLSEVLVAYLIERHKGSAGNYFIGKVYLKGVSNFMQC